MLKILENDHVRNLANFDHLLSRVLDLGGYYRPSKHSIQFDSLALVSHNAKIAIANVSRLHEQYVNSDECRRLTFEKLKEINKSIFEELRLSSGLSETEIYMLIGCGKQRCRPSEISQHYDFLLNVFCMIIKQLKMNLRYHPLKSSLQLDSLEEFYEILRQQNMEVKRNHALWCNACAIRDEILYRHQNGLVSLASNVKTYIKYHCGWNSIFYKQVAELIIRKN